ncbi:DUF4349 domain-containing protein [Alkalihalobacillus deserti]|uniref:DUF4349 domain-containing protein n=1 Tax=Alkalihalobacillus deserti TaxID=2879466 RepID=UPI001D14C483|nr:DUF4349 domain-containing protein [Alkalihalobacillus deserti]
MSRLKLFLTVFGLIFVLFGCSNQEEATESKGSVEEMSGGTENSSKSLANVEEMEIESDTAEISVANEFSSESRMVIYHGHIMFEVKNYLRARDEIQEKVKSMGGYVVESNYHEDMEGQLSGSMTVRVPKQDFQPLLDHLANREWKTIEQQTSGNDVTEEFIDLESRLKAKRVVEERLLGFMNKADNTENLLKISNELATVQAEIEQMLGRKQYIENQVEFSTISFHIQENSLSATIQGEDLNTWERSQKLFIETINTIIHLSSSVVIFLIGLSPLLLLFAICVGVIILYKKKSKKE